MPHSATSFRIHSLPTSMPYRANAIHFTPITSLCPCHQALPAFTSLHYPMVMFMPLASPLTINHHPTCPSRPYPLPIIPLFVLARNLSLKVHTTCAPSTVALSSQSYVLSTDIYPLLSNLTMK